MLFRSGLGCQAKQDFIQQAAVRIAATQQTLGERVRSSEWDERGDLAGMAGGAALQKFGARRVRRLGYAGGAVALGISGKGWVPYQASSALRLCRRRCSQYRSSPVNER